MEYKKNIKEKLAESIHCQEGTIDGWLKKYNGPSDIEIIKKIASFFGVKTKQLLKDVEEEDKEKMNNRTIACDKKEIVRKLYANMCEMIDSL